MRSRHSALISHQDPYRIIVVTLKLRKLWKKYPDYSFRELVHLVFENESDSYIDDDVKLVARLDNLFDETPH